MRRRVHERVLLRPVVRKRKKHGTLVRVLADAVVEKRAPGAVFVRREDWPPSDGVSAPLRWGGAGPVGRHCPATIKVRKRPSIKDEKSRFRARLGREGCGSRAERLKHKRLEALVRRWFDRGRDLDEARLAE